MGLNVDTINGAERAGRRVSFFTSSSSSPFPSWSSSSWSSFWRRCRAIQSYHIGDHWLVIASVSSSHWIARSIAHCIDLFTLQKIYLTAKITRWIFIADFTCRPKLLRFPKLLMIVLQTIPFEMILLLAISFWWLNYFFISFQSIRNTAKIRFYSNWNPSNWNEPVNFSLIF